MLNLEQTIIQNYLNTIDILSVSLKNSNIFITMKDQDGNIVYPKDIFLLNKANDILINGKYYYDEFSETKNLIEIYDKKNNEYYEVTNEKYAIPDSNKIYDIQIIKNISKQKQFELLSKLDPITEIYNNRAIMEKLDNCIINPNNSLNCFCFIVCDIDNFKTINDIYTHTGGDLVLKEIAKIFYQNLKTIGFVGRYGGDEFIIIIKNNNIEHIKTKINDIITKIKNIHIYYQNYDIKNITMSFGATLVNNNSLKITSLNDINSYRRAIFERADQSLYDSKRKGKDQLNVKEFTNL